MPSNDATTIILSLDAAFERQMNCQHTFYHVKNAATGEIVGTLEIMHLGGETTQERDYLFSAVGRGENRVIGRTLLSHYIRAVRPEDRDIDKKWFSNCTRRAILDAMSDPYWNVNRNSRIAWNTSRKPM